ncbi:MAG: ThiF family adenylyltransferase [Planctomycetota bacterium]|nr:MAG: ThiF family adenylyltransferase [Planctomycetota bacterium]
MTTNSSGAESIPSPHDQLTAHVTLVANMLGASPPRVADHTVAGQNLRCLQLTLPGPVSLLLVASAGYPLAAPLCLVEGPDGAFRPVALPWAVEKSSERCLLQALGAVIAPPLDAEASSEATFTSGFGLPGAPGLLTTDPDRAEQAGWQPRISPQSATDLAEQARQARFSRSSGLLGRDLEQARVVIVGCGSVGSNLAELLVRQGLGHITVIDPDHIEPSNLSRTTYQWSDCGKAKADALVRRLMAVQPWVVADGHCADIHALPPAQIDKLIDNADLVVGATDDPAAQNLLNRHCYAAGIPAVYLGCYDGAAGGEVIMVVPDAQTPCLRCAAPVRVQLEADAGQVGRNRDYGSGRLEGVVALGCDILHLTTMGAKVALALLCRQRRIVEAHLTTWLDQLLATNQIYLTASMEPDFWFYPRIFTDIPGQHAWQSLCLAVDGDDHCPVCGQHRIDPHLRAESPDLAALRGTTEGA